MLLLSAAKIKSNSVAKLERMETFFFLKIWRFVTGKLYCFIIYGQRVFLLPVGPK